MRSLPDDPRPDAPHPFDAVGRILVMLVVAVNLVIWALIVVALRALLR